MRDDYARSFTSHIPLCIEIPEFRCSIDKRHPVHMNSSFSQEFAQEHCTLLQKWIEVRFWFQATISAPYELPRGGLIRVSPYTRICLIVFSGGPLLGSSYGAGIVAGKQNLTSFHFCSSVIAGYGGFSLR